MLTKAALIQQFDRVATDRRITLAEVDAFLSTSTDPDDLFLGDYKVVETSGSSGEIGYFLFGRDDWARAMAQYARSRRLSWKRRKLAFFGAVTGHYTGVSLARSAASALGGLLGEVLLCEVNEPLAANIEKLNAFRPDVLMGYTSSLCMLAEKQIQGLLRIAPGRIDASGDPLTDSARTLLTTAFGAEIFDIYACSEHQLIAGARPPGDSMVLYDDDLICEFHDDCLIVTNLFNFTLPLIRYRLNDVLVPRGTTRGDGPYLELDTTVARHETPPVFVNRLGQEDFISPRGLIGTLAAGVRRYQIEITGRDSFRFRACLPDNLTAVQRETMAADLRQRLAAVLAQKLMDNVTFEVVLVDDLPVDPVTRKFRLVVDGRADACGAMAQPVQP